MDKKRTIYDGPFRPFREARIEAAEVARSPSMVPELLVERVLMYRECMSTERCHTVRHLGEYTVGRHVGDMLALLMALKPDASRDLMLAVLFHDFPERWLGDLPAPAKWFNADLAEEYRRAETEVYQRKKIPMPALSGDDQLWMDTIDRLEFWCWCHDQLALGNRNVLGPLGEVNGWFKRNAETLPNEVYDFMMQYDHDRTPEK